MKLLITKFWLKVEKPVWSFVINFCFWLIHLNKIGYVRVLKDELKERPLDNAMKWFEWTEDTFKDWVQWPSTLIYNDFKGDCDDAAQMAKWWFKKNGIKADILNLYNSKEGHTICVTKDRTKMVSNGNVVILNPATWEADVMEYFGNEYEVII